jgi:hypothetical protein
LPGVVVGTGKDVVVVDLFGGPVVDVVDGSVVVLESGGWLVDVVGEVDVVVPGSAVVVVSDAAVVEVVEVSELLAATNAGARVVVVVPPRLSARVVAVVVLEELGAFASVVVSSPGSSTVGAVRPLPASDEDALAVVGV